MLFLLKTLFFIDVLIAIGLLLFRWALIPGRRGAVSGKLAAIALVTPAVALFCGNIYLFCLYLAAVVAFNARSRAELAGVYLFLLPLMPALTVVTGVGGIYLLPISVVTATGLGALLGFLVTGTRGIRVPPRYDLAIWAIVGIFVFIDNHSPSATNLLRSATGNLLTFIGPYLLVSRAVRRPADVDRILLRLVGGGVIVGVTALFQARRHWVLFESYNTALHVPLLTGSNSMSLRAGLLRTGGAMVDYSAGGLFMAAALTAVTLLRPAFRPAGFWMVTTVLAGALFATQSRGAWVGAIVGIAAIGAWRGRWGRVLLLVGGAVLAEISVLTFATSGVLASILGKTDEASGNVDYRHRLATQGIAQIRAHPLFGQSTTDLVANLTDLTQGQHIVDFVNGHLFVAMAAGVPLFLVWCAVWLLPLIEGWRGRRADLALAAVPASLIVPSLVALTFTSVVDRNLIWPTVGLALAPACLALGRRRSPVPARGARSAAANRLASGPDRARPVMASLPRLESAS